MHRNNCLVPQTRALYTAVLALMPLAAVAAASAHAGGAQSPLVGKYSITTAKTPPLSFSAAPHEYDPNIDFQKTFRKWTGQHDWARLALEDGHCGVRLGLLTPDLLSALVSQQAKATGMTVEEAGALWALNMSRYHWAKLAFYGLVYSDDNIRGFDMSDVDRATWTIQLQTASGAVVQPAVVQFYGLAHRDVDDGFTEWYRTFTVVFPNDDAGQPLVGPSAADGPLTVLFASHLGQFGIRFIIKKPATRPAPRPEGRAGKKADEKVARRPRP